MGKRRKNILQMCALAPDESATGILRKSGFTGRSDLCGVNQVLRRDTVRGSMDRPMKLINKLNALKFGMLILKPSCNGRMKN